MKLYEFEAFQNPRRVRMFLAEKGIEVEREQIDVPAGEHRSEENLRRNPGAAVPFLELDNGNFISETIAISRFFEETYPTTPSLMGATAEEKATIEMWQRRVELGLTQATGDFFHHATEGLGEVDRYRNKEWGENSRKQILATMKLLDTNLANNEFIAGDRFSIADITAVCAVDFAEYLGMPISDSHINLRRWHETVSSRLSAAA